MAEYCCTLWIEHILFLICQLIDIWVFPPFLLSRIMLLWRVARSHSCPCVDACFTSLGCFPCILSLPSTRPGVVPAIPWAWSAGAGVGHTSHKSKEYNWSFWLRGCLSTVETDHLETLKSFKILKRTLFKTHGTSVLTTTEGMWTPALTHAVSVSPWPLEYSRVCVGTRHPLRL